MLTPVSAVLSSPIAQPATQLAERNVQARWLRAERLGFASDDEEDDLEKQPQLDNLGTGARSESSHRVPKAASVNSSLPVMFTDKHLRELQPRTWQQTALGVGSYGVVYPATWRGRQVAIKVLKLPDRAHVVRSEAEEILKTKVQELINDFVTEVDVMCDLNHPNLARLLGYSEHPRLMMVQERLHSSVDKALYVNSWKPTFEQVLKSAQDIARGMNYLHSAFMNQSSNQAQPIIHRDLKTPNLLLATNPLAGEPVLIKITDFGLSRDKATGSTAEQTVAMTGCGSVLWMAPEILLGRVYNEKVDVYSYSMCLLELVARQLPWTGLALPAAVPHRVTKCDRPYKQLRELMNGTVAQRGLKELIYNCWHPNPEKRPTFAEVKIEVKRLCALCRQDDAEAVQSTNESRGEAGGRGSQGRDELSKSRPASPGFSTCAGAE